MMGSSRRTWAAWAALVIMLAPEAVADELPTFANDAEADRWLREHSRAYRLMAEGVDGRGGYDIAPTKEYPGGVAYTSRGRGHIGLNDCLEGPHRVSVLIFEVTNLHQEDRHQEVAQRVRDGELEDPLEFAFLREMIEYDGLHMHHDVLQDLSEHLDEIPPPMVTWISSSARTYAEYRPPLMYDYIKAQRASGHTDHYLRLFKRHRGEYLESLAPKDRPRRREPATSPP